MMQHAEPRRSGDSGVSLVEVLVVLALVGVMAGAIGLSFGGSGQGAATEREARLLAARLTRAADEVLLSGIPMAVVWDATGYRMLQLDDGAWRPSEVQMLGRPQALARGVRLVSVGSDQIASEAGSFVVSADLLLQDEAPRRLEMRGDSNDVVAVIFDGFSARLDTGT